jgi:hypothetical protein
MQTDAAAWSVISPPGQNEPPPLAVDWFSLVRSSPAVFHVSCYMAATFADLWRGSLHYSIQPEIRMHKREAIRLVREELVKGPDIAEELILAIMGFVTEASEMFGMASASAESRLQSSPFKPSPLLVQW